MTEKVKQSAAVTGSDEIDIGRLVGTVIEARWWVLGTTAIFALCAVIYTFFATPIYSADALVQIEQNAGNSLVQDINSALANKPPASDAEFSSFDRAWCWGRPLTIWIWILPSPKTPFRSLAPGGNG